MTVRELTLPTNAAPATMQTRVVRGPECLARVSHWQQCLVGGAFVADPRWLLVLSEAFGHEPLAVECLCDGQLAGYLPLLHVRSRLFGRHLVSLPYINTAGLVADDDDIKQQLVDAARQLADELNVRHLQLRHEVEYQHPALTQSLTNKVHMRLPLPKSADELWAALSPKVRNQVRKAQKNDFDVTWGREALLSPFYQVFRRNMRDLGTPVFSRRLFERWLAHFPSEAEICVLRHCAQPIAAAILLHGRERTEVLSASTLREFNALCPNMQMYWELLTRSIERRQSLFDFGRSTLDSNTYRFKRQWGAEAHPAVWQFYTRGGNVGDLRPDNPKFALATRIWQKLPLWVANLLGPSIVKGIP